MTIRGSASTPALDTATVFKRGRGRPRTFSDEDVFQAVPVAIGKDGFQQVTLAGIAEVVGTTAQALIRRFGSKQVLIQNYLEWSIAQQLVRFAEIERQPGSPLARIYAGAGIPADPADGEATNGLAYLNMLAFAFEIRDDPIAVSLAARRSAVIELGVERLLRAAVQCGELVSMNTAAVSKVVVIALLGVHVRHASKVGASLQEQAHAALDTIFAPYRPI